MALAAVFSCKPKHTAHTPGCRVTHTMRVRGREKKTLHLVYNLQQLGAAIRKTTRRATRISAPDTNTSTELD
jgi:hypothetical protein